MARKQKLGALAGFWNRFLKILLFVTIGVVIGFFYFRQENTSYRPSKSESQIAEELSERNPDAEVFGLDEAPVKKAKAKKKRLVPPPETEESVKPKPVEEVKRALPVKIEPKQEPKPNPEPKITKTIPVEASPVPAPVPVIEKEEHDANLSDRKVMAAWQVLLERRHYSGGTIDGNWGTRSQKSLVVLQKELGIPQTGQLDSTTRERLGSPVKPFISYAITSTDIESISAPASSWKVRSTQKVLGYQNAWEMLAEKFQTTPEFLKLLNPSIASLRAETTVTVPNIELSAPLEKAAYLKISLVRKQIVAYNAQNQPMLSFPCSIAKDKDKRPSGELKVVSIIHNPNYTFDPNVLKDVAQKEKINQKLIIPPGPNNPVGTVWIGLSQPGYGIHGTPSPEQISRTGSHGCFRLANWNAEKLAKVVSVGTRVEVF